MEFDAIGGAQFERALERLQAGEPVGYRGMTLVLHGAEFECLVTLDDTAGEALAESLAATGPQSAITPERALSVLAGARFRLGALLASAQPLAAAVGNRAPRLVLVHWQREQGRYAELYELRGDRLRRIPSHPSGDGAP